MFRRKGNGSPFHLQTPDLLWVDEFIRKIRPYIFVRTADNVLIKRPNQVARLNPSGAVILKYLLDGGTIRNVAVRAGGDPKKIREIHSFFVALKAHLEGKVDPLFPPEAVEMVQFELNFTRLPVLSEIALNYRCNLRCRFCYAGETVPQTGSGTSVMNPGDVKRVLEILVREAQVPSVSFTGGEPTLVPELCGYIRHAKNLGMRVNLITNGTRIDRRFAARLRKAGLDSAQVSLEGVRAETHDRLVGAPVFEGVLGSIRFLIAEGVHTHSNTTLNRMNLGEILEFPSFVKETLGLPRFSMNLMIPVGSGAANADLVVGYAEVGAYLEALQAESERRGVEFMWYSPVPMCLFNSVLHGLGNKGCSACDGLISIAPDGTVRPCAAFPESVGHILQDGFERVWQSQRAGILRRKALAHAKCQGCENFTVCNGACPLYFQSRGYSELADEFAAVAAFSDRKEPGGPPSRALRGLQRESAVAGSDSNELIREAAGCEEIA
jgi:radical SAM protein with 4Fe4S-binding SPASM domain